MKKILFVANTLGTAGAEKALIELLRKFSGKEYEIYLYVLMNQGELIKDIPDFVTVLNEDFDDTQVLGAEGKKHLLKYSFKTLFKNGAVFRLFGYLVKQTFIMLKNGRLMTDKLLWQAMAMGAKRFDINFDMAVAFFEGGSTYYVSNYVNASKRVSFVHIAYSDAGYTPSLDRGCYDRIDRIYGVSKEVSDEFLKVYPQYREKTGVFHNIINMDGVISKSMASNPFDDGFDGVTIVTVGRLNKQKAYEVSIEACRLIKEDGINIRWFALGEGDERAFLEDLIEKSGLFDTFILKGNVENPYPYIKNCDFYVHASRFEGKSIAIQEAQILKKPIVATDCNGNREQITDGFDGFLCEFTPRGVYEAIKKLIDDPKRAELMGVRAYEKISAICLDDSEFNDFLNI